MLTLRQKQSIFASLIPLLINEAIRLGYEVTLGECYRSKEEAARLAKLKLGIPNSLHTDRLAIDINLFRNGIYLTDAEAHRQLGTFWEGLAAGQEYITVWGGHFNDANHYSIQHGGKK